MHIILVPQPVAEILSEDMTLKCHDVAIDADQITKIVPEKRYFSQVGVVGGMFFNGSLITFTNDKQEWTTAEIKDLQALIHGPCKEFVELELSEVTSIKRGTPRKAYVLPHEVVSVYDGGEGVCIVKLTDKETTLVVRGRASDAQKKLGLCLRP